MTAASLTCFCGSPAKLGSNATIYGREYGNGMAFICTRFPTCRGYVGCHPDGRPLGSIADQETKKLRMKVHALIDPLWRGANNGRSKHRNRGSVYGWMRRIMDENKDFHCGELSKEQCLKALDLIEKYPYRKPEVIHHGV